jgi:hypothetical protein
MIKFVFKRSHLNLNRLIRRRYLATTHQLQQWEVASESAPIRVLVPAPLPASYCSASLPSMSPSHPPLKPALERKRMSTLVSNEPACEIWILAAHRRIERNSSFFLILRWRRTEPPNFSCRSDTHRSPVPFSVGPPARARPFSLSDRLLHS